MAGEGLRSVGIIRTILVAAIGEWLYCDNADTRSARQISSTFEAAGGARRRWGFVIGAVLTAFTRLERID